jgi:phospholipase D1/2
MAGKPFKVGRFAHTLRVRLMREHLGIDVDSLDEDDLMANDPAQPGYMETKWDPETEQLSAEEEGITHLRRRRHPEDTVLQDNLDSTHQGDYPFLIVYNELSLML